ncbi:aminopeptidase P family protein [Amphiplicatus metriothermophilus]|uniref:Xaa-Pro aminopeptidase n=1 Tax=Amphiplicatus metriothermophilus TaxID=1519374 RepID=A0A239PTW6_9PROT|nr:aminopeptidase P family protein [Amphiplicatus metriothermophilus]MBB5519267.1 Xaa-Pro aminopeptidase [Amphiplicatus metriothermophilus]SNT73336.1 Xaa-Pro aminopeptidase [Amphiplicatus metriothermophilus]
MFQSFDPVSDRSYAAKHLPLLRAEMKKRGLDGFIVPHDDEYQNEYIPAYAERLMWVSGFSGSAGAAIVLMDRAAIFVDGRYTLQARGEVDDAFFEYESIPDASPEEWLAKNARKGWRIGYDPMLHTTAGLARLEAAAKRAGFEIVPVEDNPVDAAWADQPPRPSAKIRPHPLEFAGKSSTEKRREIAAAVKAAGADALLVTAPPSIAWLFNIRGGDVSRTPLPLGRAILSADGAASLFVAPEKVDNALAGHLGDGVDIRPEEAAAEAIRALGGKGAKVAVDPALAPAQFVRLLKESGARVIEIPDPCALPRACKNDAELAGARAAHERDGAAVTRFLYWLASEAQDGSVDEITAAKKLEALRRETGELVDISFDTISGAGPNGAIVHYRVNTRTNRRLQPGELFLIDSGAQYRDGTTDITRTVAVGKPTAEMRDRFTRVLKGHIALATARFPEGTTGHQLDAFARRPLWEAGLDYDHGTGHGVGSFLGVHEGPQRIAKTANSQPLKPGMIVSNEPGYYKAGAFGIRIENLVVVTPPEPVEGGERAMMGFETLTLAPIELDLVVPSLLSEYERHWLNRYHARVRQTLAPRLPKDVADWLTRKTRAI